MKNIISNKIQIINVILTLMIVILHSSFAWALNYVSGVGLFEKELMHYITILTTVTVGGFFTISSYLFYVNYRGINDWIPKVRKRIRTLLVPYLVWNILAYLYYFVTVIILHIFDEKKVPTNILGIVWYIIFSEGDPPLWYLRVLMIFVIVSPLIWICMKRVGKWGGIFLIAMLLFIIASNQPSYTSLLFWMPFILLGAWLAIYESSIILNNKMCYFDMNNKVLNIILISFTFGFSLLLLKLNNEGHFLFYLWRFISVIILWLFIDNNIIIENNYVKKLPTNMFFIYCTHFIVIEAVRGGLMKILGVHEWSIIPIFIITFGVTIVITYTTAKILNKFFPRLSILLTGGR